MSVAPVRLPAAAKHKGRIALMLIPAVDHSSPGAQRSSKD